MLLLGVPQAARLRAAPLPGLCCAGAFSVAVGVDEAMERAASQVWACDLYLAARGHGSRLGRAADSVPTRF